MTDPHHTLKKLLLDSGALKIWDHRSGPVFWGAAKLPMPFYINTEQMIGPPLAADLLQDITAICAGSSDADPRAKRLHSLILKAYDSTPVWQQIIQAMLERARTDFPAAGYQAISGGERRDWLFSIPFAQEAGRKHLYLFKDRSSYCEQPVKAGERVLHVCDLINNGASHFDMWFPMLTNLQLVCAGTLAINSRGSNGMNRLQGAGIQAAVLNGIALPFFEQLAAGELIERSQLEEISVFFRSPKDWAAQYLMNRSEVFQVPHLDAKSFERMQDFFNADPWGLRETHAVFFQTMQRELAAGRAA